MKPTLRIITEHRRSTLKTRHRGVPRRPRTDSNVKAASTREQAAEAIAEEPPAPLDSALLRIRAAGGPVDEASFTCQCGYVFAASVSTTVTCPHCGASQAW